MTGQPGLRIPSAGFDRGWSPIPRERLHPVDLYHMLDWIRDGWNDDELLVTPRLQRLEWHLEELPDPYRADALEEYAILTQARIAKSPPWLAALTALRRIVWEWDKARALGRSST